VLNGGRLQDEFGEVQCRVVAGVEPACLPRGGRVAGGEGGDVGEVAEQATQHALRVGIDAGNGEHSFACGPQDPVFGDVDGELVVADLQRERKPVVPVQLLALAQPAAQHL